MPLIMADNPDAPMDYNPFFFVHVPKCAGNSMATALHKVTQRGKGCLYRHATAWRLRGHYKDEWDDAFTFGFVRNPFDQAVSWWLYHERIGQAAHCMYDSFDEWVKGGMPHGWGSTSSFFHARPWFEPYPGPDKAPEPYDPMRMLFDPHTGEQLVDFIGRLENLDKDWAWVCQQIGKQAPLAKQNASPDRGHYRDYYTAESRRIVADTFQDAIDHFGYEF